LFYTISKLAFSRNPRFDPQKIQKKKQAKQLKSKLKVVKQNKNPQNRSFEG